MRAATKAILPVSESGGAPFRSAKVGNITTSPSSPVGGVGGDSPSAATTSGCGTGPTICADSLPRIQAVMGKVSVCTLVKPRALRCVTAQSAAWCSLSEPAGRGPKRVVSSLTQSHAAFCPAIAASRSCAAVCSGVGPEGVTACATHASDVRAIELRAMRARIPGELSTMSLCGVRKARILGPSAPSHHALRRSKAAARRAVRVRRATWAAARSAAAVPGRSPGRNPRRCA